jgi:hypothetical protein
VGCARSAFQVAPLDCAGLINCDARKFYMTTLSTEQQAMVAVYLSLRSSALRFGQVVNRTRENLREPTRQR